MIKEKYFSLSCISSRFGDPEGTSVLAYSKSKETLIKYLSIIKEEIKQDDITRVIKTDEDIRFVYTDKYGKWCYTYDISEEIIKIIDDSDLLTKESIEKIEEWDIWVKKACNNL